MTNITDMELTAEKTYASMRTGKVVSFSAAMLVVNIGGTQIRAGYLATYGPTVGDTVAVTHQDGSWLVHGRVVGT